MNPSSSIYGHGTKKTLIVSPQHPLWNLAFRPFFLLAAISSSIAIAFWALYLSGMITGLGIYPLNPSVWHLHEMIFGFGATCAIGFLLTAAQTWTSARSVHGKALIMLTLLWLSARVSFWQGALATAMIMQGLWWISCIGILARLLIENRSHRNYQFIPLLLIMASLNLGVLYAEYVGRSDISLHLGRTAILMFGILVSIVGGRIIPLFTRNATRSAKIRSSTVLDYTILAVSIIGTLLFFLYELTQLPITPAWLMIAAGALHLFRLSRWDSMATISIPLLWSLHATYLCLGLGLIGLGASYFVEQLTFADALHLIAVGTIGGMILAMISRVSLGHTGRPLQTKPAINVAFCLILLSAFTRFILPLFGWVSEGWVSSAVLWSIAFAIFAFHYLPILTQARQG